ncbi:MAG: glycosyltransferase family 2 protein [Lachnospiraceae bacterium]|nr:glycosyltransferase family 2 protein [Lachnospiraceae bacterium]
MKVLSIAVPCYNSQSYMKKCIDSLLKGGEDVEIIIVDDGSTDKTAQIADRYARLYPSVVRVIHKPNGGHGSGVNAGIEQAKGLYFKVVDSDDWVREDAYLAILDRLRELLNQGRMIDMFISNFVYEKEGVKKCRVMRYHRTLPENVVFTWKDVGRFRKGQYILMHSVIYRTGLLRECGLKLPEHTFYVDNMYVFEPLPYVKEMYYLDVNFYRYYIGRADQSVNEQVMIGRIDQQLKVNRLMMEYLVEHKQQLAGNRKCRSYMLNYLDIITTISSIMLIRADTEESLAKKKDLWEYLKGRDAGIWRRLRYGLLGNAMNLPGKGGRRISVEGYKLCQRFFNFN